jgi:1,4-alpha-glucan branching enzyme
VNYHWLDVYHIDGFRYDCVPNYWDGPLGVGYASLVYETYQLTKGKLAQHETYWTRFDAGPGEPIRLIQCAEQLEGPEEVLQTTYSNSTWQNRTFAAARAVARGDRGNLTDLGLSLGLFGYPDRVNVNQDDIPKAALQYIENHDHERFVCNFGLYNPDEAGNPLFAEGDRSRWFMLQPYLIALLMSKGIPMLWQGEEFAENHFLPDFGEGRVALLRPLRWDYFYDGSGQPIVTLVRKLLRGAATATTWVFSGPGSRIDSAAETQVSGGAADGVALPSGWPRSRCPRTATTSPASARPRYAVRAPTSRSSGSRAWRSPRSAPPSSWRPSTRWRRRSSTRAPCGRWTSTRSWRRCARRTAA